MKGEDEVEEERKVRSERTGQSNALYFNERPRLLQKSDNFRDIIM
jgi:hypothetical protein